MSLGGLGDDRPHPQRSPQQGPGLAAVDRLELAQRSVDPLVQGLLFRLEVGHLAGHHPRRPGRLGQDPHATQRRRHRFHLAGDHLERQRQEPVPGQDRRRLVKRLVAGRPAAPQVVVVHRRQVVVDQRIGMNHLQRTGRRHRRLGIAAARLGRHQAKHRPQPLATPQHAVTHRRRQPRRRGRPATGINLRQIPVQCIIHPMSRLVQVFAERNIDRCLGATCHGTVRYVMFSTPRRSRCVLASTGPLGLPSPAARCTRYC